MTAIAHNSDLAKKDYCLDKIENASSHLLGIINDILDMSKIEEGKLELLCTEFNFYEMIQRVINIFEFRLSEKEQKLSIYLDENIPERIITDEQRLAQVITNLISNAIKFTPDKGDIFLSVRRLEGKDEKFCILEICVTDTGIGIPKDMQDKLFQSFVQVDSSIARKYGGTGLGLSISQKIVELMHGEIQLESEEGKGTKLSFDIRAAIPENLSGGYSAASANAAGAKTALEKNPAFIGKHILLAEDMEINREIVITLLEPYGIKITEAEDGQKAYDLFRADPEGFDLIFMDIHMPEVNGYESARLIREHEDTLEKEYPHKRVPIIAMTANVFKEDIENCITAGMDSHIGKPLDFDAVIAALKHYLV